MIASVSVIVPVFNAAETIERCIASLLAQSHPLSQIVIVDDGSTDESLYIARSFEKKHPSVQVHVQPNAGVSAARNRGLRLSSGDYIGFVDPDDFVSPQMYSRLLESGAACGVSVVALRRHSILPPPAETNSGVVHLLDSSVAISRLLQLRYPSSAWAHLYTRDVLMNVRFDARVSFFEDLLFNFEVLRVVDRVALVEGDYYHYQPGASGANLSPFSKRDLSALLACASIRQVVRSESLPHRQDLALLESHCLEAIIYKIAKVQEVDQETYVKVREFARSIVRDCLTAQSMSKRRKSLVLASAISPRLVHFTTTLSMNGVRAARRVSGRTKWA